MLEKNDWRLLNQESYLKNAKLVKAKYSKQLEEWDHAHCAFCFDKFSENSEDLNIGYCTENREYWICEDCFNDFKDLFEFKVEE
ncbi:MAG: hypothetical protein ACLUFN_07820 [Eubacterium sp.]